MPTTSQNGARLLVFVAEGHEGVPYNPMQLEELSRASTKVEKKWRRIVKQEQNLLEDEQEQREQRRTREVHRGTAWQCREQAGARSTASHCWCKSTGASHWRQGTEGTPPRTTSPM